MSDSRRSQATTQRLELSELAEADISQKMGWQKLPNAAIGALRYWLFRFFDHGAGSERDKTITAMKERDEARSQIVLLQSRNEQLERLCERLRNELLDQDPERHNHIDIPFDKDGEE